MDRFRIRAMERILERGDLDDDQRNAVLRMLLEKIDIYLSGSSKRSKRDEVNQYKEKRDRIVRMMK